MGAVMDINEDGFCDKGQRLECEREYDISAAYGISHWWFKRKEFYITRHSAPSDRSKVRSHMRILSVLSLKTLERYGYTYLKDIVLRIADYKEYKISEADFQNLHPNDFEDLKRVEDLHLGIESYQTKLNLTQLDWDASDFLFKEDYTIVSKHRAIIYRDRNDQKKMMRETETSSVEYIWAWGTNLSKDDRRRSYGFYGGDSREDSKIREYSRVLIAEFYKTDVILMSASLSKNLKELKEEFIEEVQEMLNIFESMEQSQAQSTDFELKLQHQKEKMACDVSWKSKLSTLNDENLFNSIKATWTQHKKELDELIEHVNQKTYAYADVRAQNQDLLITISELKNKLKTVDKGKNVNTKFEKSEALGTLLCVTPLPKNIAIKAKKVSNSKVNADRSKPVTSHPTPTNEQVESSNSVRIPKSKDTKSKNRVLKNTKISSTYVRKISRSVSIDSNKCETKDSNVIQLVLWIVDSGCSKHMTGNLQLLRNFVEKFMGIVRFGNDHFIAITGYGDYVQGNLTICHHPKQKKAAKNHDLLTLLAHLNASSSQSHANSSYSPQLYYVTHLSSVVDDKDEYQGELQGDSQEDKLTTAMMLLARAITYNFSTPTNNHLCTSSNTRNQAMVQDGRVDIQTVFHELSQLLERQMFSAITAMKKATMPVIVQNPRIFREAKPDIVTQETVAIIYAKAVHDVKMLVHSNVHEQLEHELRADKDTIERILKEKDKIQSDFFKIENEKLLIQHETQLARKAFKEQENQYIEDIVDLKEKLTEYPDRNSQPKIYDGERLHSAKLTIDSPDSEGTLEDAEESRLKMRNKMVQINYGKLNALYEIFVPQHEFSVEQTYFSIPSKIMVLS
ncbi:hypothetical protein Tco_1326557 [Tanacetum coccineum]